MYSPHQEQAAKLASRNSSCSSQVILEWCAVAQPTHENWAAQHSKSVQELALEWANQVNRESASISRVYAHTDN